MKKRLTQPYNRLKIGANIRKWRNIREIKQKDLAASLCLSEAAISNIENNITDVTLSQLEDISLTLDIPVEHLFCDPQESLQVSYHGIEIPTGKKQFLLDKELLTTLFANMQRKDEQLQSMMQHVLLTMSAIVQDDKKFA